jgi:2-polyprenyl-3-methyl-5-hydroxy-6-metoxy-1,4-benzoquinol methylase
MTALNEGIRVNPVPACPLCGEPRPVLYARRRDPEFGAPGEWSLRECRTCAIAWLDPQPTPEDLGKLYTRYFTHGKEAPASAARSWKGRLYGPIVASTLGYPGGGGFAGAALSLVRPLREHALASASWLPARPGGKLLDVGCGDGAFLDWMRHLGWSVTGVDPDPRAAEMAQERYGIRVVASGVDTANFPPASFDAVTLNHVLEHVLEPVDLLRRCREVVAPGGRIVCVTPNVESLGRRRFGPHWRAWDSPRHLNLFSRKSLAEAARRAGLKVGSISTGTRLARFIFNESRPGTAVSRRVQAGAFCFWFEEMLLSRLGPAGEELVMVARPENNAA